MLLAHAYGAGRVAYLGTENTWVWPMSGGDRGAAQHRQFWTSLLSWLSATGKARLSAPIHGKLVPLDRDANLRITVLGNDFRPAPEARVAATMHEPNGESTKLRLTPVPGRPGTFDHAAQLAQEGEYKIEYRAELPGGETLNRTAFFSAAPIGRENQDVAFREAELRDIARLSGGRYLTPPEAGALRSLPISPRIPLKERPVPWTRNFPFLSILLTLLFVEWLVRRRHGLR